MVLDHSGPDLALILYGASLKLFLFGALFVRLALGFRAAEGPAGLALFAAGLLGFAVLVGVVESVMARLRLARVPQLLVGASLLSTFGLVLLLR
jgi:formate hydrogenlyase subunit 4